MTKVIRNYKMKDVDMLIASSTIAQTAKRNEDFLAGKRSTWQSPYFENLSTRIDLAISTYLGVDSAKTLRQETQLIMTLQGLLLPLLAEVKIQIIEDFKDTPVEQKEILKSLGFEPHHATAKKGDQEAIIELLNTFKTNVPDIQTQLVAKGIAKKTITDILDFVDKFKDVNVNQEGKKGIRKEITAEGITEFNAIHSSIMSICKIGSKFFKGNTAVQEQLSFSKVAKNLNRKPSK